jgi:hypothetical protein
LFVSEIACSLGKSQPITEIPPAGRQTPTFPSVPAKQTPSLMPVFPPASPVATSLIQITARIGQAYYVANNDIHASDSNNGLYPDYRGEKDGPWATIQHAAVVIVAGDITRGRAGTYYEDGIIFTNSGLQNKPITLANFEAEQVILDGSKSEKSLPGIFITRNNGHYVIRGFTIRNMPDSGIATDPETTTLYQDITILDCILSNNGWSGIELAAVDGFVIKNVESYHNAYYGMNIGASKDGSLSSSYGVVKNSSFHDHTGKEGHGLAFNQAHDIVVSDNTAYHNRIHGFDVSDWPKKGDLSHDIVYERNTSFDNGVAGFAVNSDSHHILYRNNTAWHNGADWAGIGSGSGFLCYEGCWHIEWDNKVSVENSDAGFWVEDQLSQYGIPADNLLIFKNNITYNNGRPDWDVRLALCVEGTPWQVIATNNNWGGTPSLNTPLVAIHLIGDKGETYTADQINKGAFQEGNVSVDPKLINMGAADFHLQPDSPMIDAGIDVGIPFCRAEPDMGALEVCP